MPPGGGLSGGSDGGRRGLEELPADVELHPGVRIYLHFFFLFFYILRKNVNQVGLVLG